MHIGFDFSSEQPTVKITPEVPEYFALREGRIKIKANEIRGEFLDEFIKEHEEHIKCLEHFVNEMKSAECRYGSNIFGEEYL